MIVSLNLVDDSLDELEKRFKMLADSEVEIGVFDNTTHHDNWTYVSLITYLAQGNPKMNLPPRDVLSIAMSFNPLSKNTQLKKDLKKFFKNIKTEKTQKDADKVLTNLGIHYSTKVKNLFGDPKALAENSPATVAWKRSHGYVPAQSPLVMTGKLREKIKYRINGE